MFLNQMQENFLNEEVLKVTKHSNYGFCKCFVFLLVTAYKKMFSFECRNERNALGEPTYLRHLGSMWNELFTVFL